MDMVAGDGSEPPSAYRSDAGLGAKQSALAAGGDDIASIRGPAVHALRLARLRLVAVLPLIENDMRSPEVFALNNSPVNPFLFAEVGLEISGVPLTVLSVLARLGEDPWSQAQNWASLSKETVVDQLADCIRQMPMGPEAIRDARITAKRLILLLPRAQKTIHAVGESVAGNLPAGPHWVRAAILIGAMGVGIAINVMLMSAQTAPVAVAASQGLVSGTPSVRPDHP